MSSLEVELVARFIELFTSGDVAAAGRLLSPDAVIDEPADLPFSGQYLGPAGLSQLAQNFPRSLRIRVQSVTVGAGSSQESPGSGQPAPSIVVSRLALSFQSRASGRQVVVPAVEVYSVQGGRITQVDVYYKSASELRALIAESG